jgi:hypothetical protein
MNKKSIYEQRARDRERLLKIKEQLKPVNKILEQVKPLKVETKTIKK